MRVNLVQESARHLQMTRARQMRVDTRDLPEALLRAKLGRSMMKTLSKTPAGLNYKRIVLYKQLIVQRIHVSLQAQDSCQDANNARNHLACQEVE